ncbi:EAL domain-containing protein [Billgrantia bachuensis]|uniref:EAL domain-containing protein n=1 Tax=Billgrantia bachuensis TaxID=2717286 RepID=A0ABX0PQA2_9GAMM|nr:EAL domain-containing protein [Halomonas bachuensis]NIC04343.1 EAL domain-containing protein [Halomonas bachuensis]
MRIKLIKVWFWAVGLTIIGVTTSASHGQVETSEPAKVVFVGSATYRPFQWVPQDGQAKGFVIDLQDSLAQQGNRVAEHRLMAWEEAIESVRLGQADVIPLLASEGRKEDFDFTEPFYYLSHGIFSLNNKSYRTLNELVGGRVAVVRGSYAATRLEEEQHDFILVEVETERDCLVAVNEQEADACVEVVNTSRRHAAETQVEQTSAPFWPQPYVFGVRKGNDEMLSWLNTNLALIQAEGTYHDIYHEWIPELEWHKHRMSDWLRYFYWLLLPLSFATLLGFSLSWYLKRLVRFRTRRLYEELTAKRELEKELRYKADYDEVTGLPSRAAFIDNLGRLLEERSELAPTVILLRLLNLEQLTSLFGYHFGHELLLQEFSSRLESLGFAQISHFGSGVFAIVRKHEMSHEDIVVFVSESLEIGKLNISANVVMGISEGRAEVGHKSQSEAEELVRRAMTAYSAATKASEAWRVYTGGLEPDPNDLILVEDFRRFGTRDMYLLYQPKLDLTSGYIKEAEALVRWQHPTLGFVPPGHFIGLLEETGLIKQLTYWVLKESVAQIERCRSHDPDFSISVNVSARDLAEGYTLVDYILSLKQFWYPQGLCLEITETGVIQDHDHAQKVVSELHEANISCAIDDFGTGYASLSYLSKFSVDEVKLDRSFIANMMESEKDRAIIASTINLAHKMGLRVTAEGVEDEATLQALAKMGCDTAQGYLISRPIPEAELYRFMCRRHFVETLLLPAEGNVTEPDSDRAGP